MVLLKVYADGSGYTNGCCAICVKFEYTKADRGNVDKINKKKDYLKVFYEEIPSETLEYLALIKALELIPNKESIVFSDNMSVVDEVNGIHKAKEKNKENYLKAKSLIDSKTKVKVMWIPRDKNLAGIYLDKRLKTIKKKANTVLYPMRYLVNRRRQWKDKVYGRRKI